MLRATAVAGGLLVALPALTGCGGSSVDSACEVDALTHEVEHMVGESQLTVASVDSVQCYGDWSVVGVTVSGDAASTETFVFRKVADSWVLKAPEVACEGGAEAIPEALAGDVCPAAA